jgi:hypothetical protein
VAGVDPDVVVSNRQPSTRAAPSGWGWQADRVNDRAIGRVDLCERPVVHVYDPERIAAGGDRPGALAHRDDVDDVRPCRVDDCDRVWRDAPGPLGSLA